MLAISLLRSATRLQALLRVKFEAVDALKAGMKRITSLRPLLAMLT